jgi:1-deoxy-D-xylulose-5-phosphate reductoisomerase
MKKIAILGSTGSIGTQTLDVAREQTDLEIVALSCGSNIKLMEEQMKSRKRHTMMPLKTFQAYSSHTTP